jgi:hypothetical protein
MTAPLAADTDMSAAVECSRGPGAGSDAAEPSALVRRPGVDSGGSAE